MITRSEIVRIARGWIGTPYHHQASLKGEGCDCLGLVRGVYREIYGKEAEAIPAYTRDWGEVFGDETLLAAASRHLVQNHSVKQAMPGDVLIFRLNQRSIAKHAGILSTAQMMVHSQENVGCVEVTIGSWWQRRVAGVFQFPGL